MLNISNTSITKYINLNGYTSGQKVIHQRYYTRFNLILRISLVLLVLILFIPWTQNITGSGQVTTLQPSHRPQTIQSAIPGRVEEWFVREGDLVDKGDTILRISEVKSEYFDQKLLERTNRQITAKTSSVGAYQSKLLALKSQVAALKEERGLKLQQAANKLQQAQLKVISDSIDLVAAETNQEIAQTQYDRTEMLRSEGLKSRKDVEEKRLKLQSTTAKRVAQQNKLLESKNKVINAQLEQSRIKALYADKIAKSESDFFTAESARFTTEAEVQKLENQYANYKQRNSLRYITAPQSGQINKAIIGGVGETFKEGQKLVTIMPSDYELAVETFVRPIDLPLIHIDEAVRVQFDGWPAIVFSGWENVSYGTYGARVVAIDNFISENGKYRVLLAPDEQDNPWPNGIRVGSGAKTIALLNDVPIWYELWRQLNGFPPQFYNPKDTSIKDKK